MYLFYFKTLHVSESVSMNILVVDDYITNISILRVTLTKIGHTVFTARDGVEATTILKSESIDAVFTDWMMPNLDGIGLIRWIRATLHPTPILIVTTALGSSEAQAQALEAGADAYIVKPVSPGQIESTMKEIEQKRSALTQQKFTHSMAHAAASGPDFFGIGLVAGTGGASGVRAIFSQFESTPHAAWFIVLHGPGWAAEALAEQMQSYSHMRVTIPRDGDRIEPNVVYIAPGDKHMVVAGKNPGIQLTSTPPENFLRPSADPLFISIAKVFGRRSIGVMLGGTGSDGYIGCGHIKVSQGIVIVQEPANAVSSQMPQHVISLGLATQVLPLEKIAAGVIGQVRKHSDHASEHVMPETTGSGR
jgi:two-component system, chemotaxis family, protein-glutamate methylesterase/glutaminase